MPDRHVSAAAIKANADVIVTFNLSDFPQTILDQYEVEAQHPDDFISYLLDLKPAKVAAASEICRKRLKNPPKTLEKYLEILLRQGLSVSVSMLQELNHET